MPIKHSLVIPCYNEEGNVAAFFDAAVAAMQGYTEDYELVFVNDGSRDGTEAALRRLLDTHPETALKVVCFSRNFGKEAAMYAGLREARGEYVTVIDADLQQPPIVAVQMGRYLDEHDDCDMVAAVQETRREGRLLAFCKRRFYRLINKVSQVHFIPDASDFRTMRRTVTDTLLSLAEYHRFSKGLFAFVGFRTHAVPYEVKPRQSGTTKWSFTKLFRYALDGIIAYTDLPLRLPLYAGGLLTAAGVLTLIALLILCAVGYALSTVSLLVALLLFVGGLLLIGQGLLGLYVSRIHTQVKQRPIYIAREILTNESSVE